MTIRQLLTVPALSAALLAGSAAMAGSFPADVGEAPLFTASSVMAQPSTADRAAVRHEAIVHKPAAGEASAQAITTKQTSATTRAQVRADTIASLAQGLSLNVGETY